MKEGACKDQDKKCFIVMQDGDISSTNDLINRPEWNNDHNVPKTVRERISTEIKKRVTLTVLSN
jgi:hypothetical protein